MSVVRFHPLHRGRTGSAGEKWSNTYESAFRLITDNPADNLYVVGNYHELPKRYEQYPDDPTALCLNVDVRPEGDESGLLWEAIAHYSTSYDYPYPRNPLQRPARWSIRTTRGETVAAQDIFGNPIVNLAFDYYDPPLPLFNSRLSLQAVRNEGTFHDILNRIDTFKDAINADAFGPFRPFTLMVAEISCGESQFENGVLFYPVTYALEYNPLTWLGRVLERGFNGISEIQPGEEKEIINPRTGKPIKIRGKRYKTVKLSDSEPVKLFANPDGTVRATRDISESTFTDWHVQPECAFRLLSLELPMN